jgi:hypothetical protein
MANVARSCENVLTHIRLRICRITFASLPQLDLEKAKHEKRTFVERYMDGMNIQPLQKAFLMFLRTSDCEQDKIPEASDAFYCRTNWKGELLPVYEQELDEEEVKDKEFRAEFYVGASYMYLWTFSRAYFRRVLKDIQANTAGALGRHEFTPLTVQERRMDAEEWREWQKKNYPFSLLEAQDDWHNAQKMFFLRHNVLPNPATTAAFYDGSLIGGADARWKVSPRHFYIFANSGPINALYTSELIAYHAISLRQKTADDFATFSQAMDVCETSTEQCRVESLDRRWPTPNRDSLREYYRYAFQCATSEKFKTLEPDADKRRKLFAKAIDVLVNQDGWKEPARRIAEANIRHPSLGEDGDTVIKWYFAPKNVVLGYYDFYTFGAEERGKAWVGIVDSAEENIEKALRSVRSILRGFMKRRLGYTGFLKDIDAHWMEEFDKRKEIHDRYLDMALNGSFPWWKEFEIERESTWEELKEPLKWVGEGGHKAGELFAHHFGELEHILEYNEMLHSKLEETQEALRKLVKYNERLNGRTVQRKFKGEKLEVHFSDGPGGTVTVKIKGGTAKPVEFNFFSEVTEEMAERRVPARRTKHSRGKMVVKRVTVKARNYHLETHFEEFQAWPEWLETFGETLAFAVSVADLIKQISQGEEATTGTKVRAGVNVARDTFLLAGGLSGAISSCYVYARVEWDVARKLKALERAAELKNLFQGPGLVIEAALNVYDGATILILGEDSASAEAVRAGEPVVAWLQEAKGLVLVASAVPGAVAGGAALIGGAGAAAAFAAALSPLGIGLAIGGLVVLALDIAIYLHEGPTNVMNSLRKALDEAIRHEFDYGGKDRTYDSIKVFADKVTLLLETA